MKSGCRFHTLQFLMVLTSRDKVFGFKRKMHFWKTLCYKKENEMFPLLLELQWRRYQQVSSLIRNHLGKLLNTLNLFSFPQNKFINEQVLFSWIIWLQETDLEKKKRRSCSPIHSRWVLLICPEKFWISVKNRISCYS